MAKGREYTVNSLTQRLKRYFVTGIFVTLPLIISVYAMIWLFRAVDGLSAPLYLRILGRRVPGLGLLTTLAVVFVVGLVATNVVGRRLLRAAERLLLRVPVFRTIYAPVRQLVVAFSPESQTGFKRVVIADDPRRGFVLGFLTREFSMERNGQQLRLAALYVPTNHVYLGEVIVVPRESLLFPDITVEEGIRIFLTGGMALEARLSPLERKAVPGRGSGENLA